MDTRFLGIACLCLTLVTAGCATQEPPPHDPGKGAEYGTLSSVSWTVEPPEEGIVGRDVLVCWHVEGQGLLQETAVATSLTSQPDAEDYTAYDWETFYQRNESAAVAFDAPVDFCTAVTMPSSVPDGGHVFLRAYAYGASPPGVMSSSELSIRVVPPTWDLVQSISFENPPTTAPAGTTREVCWRLEGEGEADRTSLHTDTSSHAGSTDRSAYDGATYFPGNGASPSPVALPGTYCADVQIPQSGSLYLRAHAIDRDGTPGRFSGEHRIRATATVGNVTFTEQGTPWVGGERVAPPGSTVEVCWRVEGTPGPIPGTSLHTDNESHAGAGSVAPYDGRTYYPGNAGSASEATVPGTFCTDVTAPTNGTLYLRAFAEDGTGAGKVTPTERVVRSSATIM